MCLDQEAALALSSQLPSLDPIASTFDSTRVKEVCSKKFQEVEKLKKIIPQVLIPLKRSIPLWAVFRPIHLT